MNHTMPKISVIVPVYNVEKYVQRCIDSILNQSFTDFEIIIINDVSPDCSIEIIKKYYGNNSKVRIQENEQNLGLGPTRNYGIKVAYGKYIAFIDSDDYIEFDFLKILYETAERENADIVSCGYKTVNDSGIIRNYHDIPMVLNGGIGALDRLMTIHPMMPVWMRLYKRSLLQKNNLLFSPILAEDILLIMSKFRSIKFHKQKNRDKNSNLCYRISD